MAKLWPKKKNRLNTTCEINNKYCYDLSHYLFGSLLLALEHIPKEYNHPATQG